MQALPMCQGANEYTQRFDVLKFATFLHERGLSPQRIARLRVIFVHRRVMMGDIAGGVSCFGWGRTITIYMSAITPARLSALTSVSQQEALYEMNEVLMHETKHILDQEQARALHILSSIMHGVPALLAPIIFWYGGISLHAPLGPIAVVAVAVWIIAARLCYRYDPLEVRANVFERQYGRSYMFFK